MLERHLGPVSAPRQPGEFTVHELAAIRRISGKRANVVLYGLMSRGLVTRRLGHKNQYLYRFVE